jgi:hypothetical protein
VTDLVLHQASEPSPEDVQFPRRWVGYRRNDVRERLADVHTRLEAERARLDAATGALKAARSAVEALRNPPPATLRDLAIHTATVHREGGEQAEKLLEEAHQAALADVREAEIAHSQIMRKARYQALDADLTARDTLEQAESDRDDVIAAARRDAELQLSRARGQADLAMAEAADGVAMVRAEAEDRRRGIEEELAELGRLRAQLFAFQRRLGRLPEVPLALASPDTAAAKQLEGGDTKEAGAADRGLAPVELERNGPAQVGVRKPAKRPARTPRRDTAADGPAKPAAKTAPKRTRTDRASARRERAEPMPAQGELLDHPAPRRRTTSAKPKTKAAAKRQTAAGRLAEELLGLSAAPGVGDKPGQGAAATTSVEGAAGATPSPEVTTAPAEATAAAPVEGAAGETTDVASAEGAASADPSTEGAAPAEAEDASAPPAPAANGGRGRKTGSGGARAVRAKSTTGAKGRTGNGSAGRSNGGTRRRGVKAVDAPAEPPAAADGAGTSGEAARPAEDATRS